jgi:cytochrome c5
MLRSQLRISRGMLVGCAFAVLAAPLPLARAADGEAVYKAACNTCHDSGAGNAPRLARIEEWKERFASGRAALHAAAIDGVPSTAMAAKGGFVELSDAEVRAAVDYMLERTGFVEPAQPRPAARSVAVVAPAADAAHPGDVVLTARVAAALKSALARPNAPIESQDAELIVRGIGIRVRALGGTVRLMGVVEDSSTVKRAESIAQSIAGVRSVDNRLVSGGMLDFD